MEILKKDPKLAEKEEQERIANIAYTKQRDAFFDALKKNKDFQTFFVEGVLQKHIDNVTDIRQIAVGSPESMVIMVMARKQICDILEKIMRLVS